MSLSARRHHFSFGTEPLLELPWDDADDELAVIERIRQCGSLDTDTDGSVLGTDSWQNNHRTWYNSGWGNGQAHKTTYEEWLNSDRRTKKEKERDAFFEHMRERKRIKDEEREGREQYEYALAQSNMGLRSWAAQQAAETPEHREARYARQVENAAESRHKAERNRVDEELARKVDEEEHERKRQWALYTSSMERRITEIADSVDANADDRELMRAMLRYMNLGAGRGQQWDADTFARARGNVDKIDVERCYNLLKNRYLVDDHSAAA